MLVLNVEAEKNHAFRLVFTMPDSATPTQKKTGRSPSDDAYSSNGGAAYTALAIADTASEIGSSGMYEINLTASEMNYDQITIMFTAADASDVMVHINTLAIKATAGQVWDESVFSHQTGGTFGQLITSFQAVINQILAAVNIIDGIVDSILVDTDTTIPDQITALNDVSEAEVNAQVDLALADYDGPTNAEMNAAFAALVIPTAAAIADAVLRESVPDHEGVGDSLAEYIDQINSVVSALPSANTIRDAILAWDASNGEDFTPPATSLGMMLFEVSEAGGWNTTTPLSAAQIAAAVWDALASAHTDAGSFGALNANINTNVNSLIASLTVAAIADAVWNELRSGHTDAGSFGATSEWAGGSFPTVQQIVDGVLDEDMITHSESGSLARKVRDIASVVNDILAEVNSLDLEVIIDPSVIIVADGDSGANVNVKLGAGRPEVVFAAKKKNESGVLEDYDLTGKKVRLIIHNGDSSSVVVEENETDDSITIDGNKVTFDYSDVAAATATQGQAYWELWEIQSASEGHMRLGTGNWFVDNAVVTGA